MTYRYRPGVKVWSAAVIMAREMRPMRVECDEFEKAGFTLMEKRGLVKLNSRGEYEAADAFHAEAEWWGLLRCGWNWDQLACSDLVNRVPELEERYPNIREQIDAYRQGRAFLLRHPRYAPGIDDPDLGLEEIRWLVDNIWDMTYAEVVKRRVNSGLSPWWWLGRIR